MASTTKPRSIIRWDSTLKTDVRRIYGYQPYCACGWEGHVWKTHRESQLERSFHECASEPER
jgi:hypothetical protein